MQTFKKYLAPLALIVSIVTGVGVYLAWADSIQQIVGVSLRQSGSTNLWKWWTSIEPCNTDASCNLPFPSINAASAPALSSTISVVPLFVDAASERMNGVIAAGNDSITTSNVPFYFGYFDGVFYDRPRSAASTNLTAVTSRGAATTVPLSTWSITNTPAAATQATISKAAGGGTVRHVATTITACSAQAGTAQTPIAINLRDGATGAGTILRTWKISTIIQDSKCVNLSGLAMIGTANTAMTIEFAAAGVAASEQTVTLTGFSVP